MPKNNSKIRREERRVEAVARNERNAGKVIDCEWCKTRHVVGYQKCVFPRHQDGDADDRYTASCGWCDFSVSTCCGPCGYEVVEAHVLNDCTEART